VAAPVLAVATVRLPRRTLIVGGLSAFAVANTATALAPNYATLMAARVVTALIAATVSPAAFAMAARLAAPERMGRAIGTVAAGLTLSLFTAVPAGTLLGDAFGWRSTFVAVAVATALVAAAGAAAVGLAAYAVTALAIRRCPAGGGVPAPPAPAAVRVPRHPEPEELP
jgi:predicted MFS family arabinose efflux permease